MRDKPNLLSEIRRATHYGVTPEKQEVDDLRTEVGSLRLQVTDMDSRIDALSRMVDRLLDERSTTGGGVGVGGVAGAVAPERGGGVPVKHEILPGAGWAKKRRLDADWDGNCDTNTAATEVARLATGSPRVKMEAGEESGMPAAAAAAVAVGRGVEGMARPKAEPTEQPVYHFPPAEVGDAASAGIIVGGGALLRDSSFLRDLDSMSIGSHGSMGGGGGSLGPLQLVDVTTDEDDSGDCDGGSRSGLDVLNESFFDIDFDAEITSMPGSEHPDQVAGAVSEQQRQPLQPLQQLPSSSLPSTNDGAEAATAVSIDEDEPAIATAPPPAATVAATTDGVGAADQEAKFEELTASLDSMPAESRRKLVEGMLALAQNPAVFSTLANAGAAGVSAPAAHSAEISSAGSSSSATTATSVAGGSSDGGVGGGVSRSAATEAPEIAMPLASAALCAFAMHYLQAEAVKEPTNAMSAVAMDPSRHNIKRTASLR